MRIATHGTLFRILHGACARVRNGNWVAWVATLDKSKKQTPIRNEREWQKARTAHMDDPWWSEPG
jgi:hypothetical protein